VTAPLRTSTNAGAGPARTRAVTTRAHAVRTGDGPVSPAVGNVRPARAVQLRIVPRRRRAAGFAVFLSVLVAAVMLGTAVLHTQLAERQLEIDRVERAVDEAQQRFDVLRRQRAELRAPTHLAAEASRLGMVPSGGDGDFVAVDAWTMAQAIAASGSAPTPDDALRALEPLDQYRLVKQVDGAGAVESPIAGNDP
jgi:hypothetical protein